MLSSNQNNSNQNHKYKKKRDTTPPQFIGSINFMRFVVTRDYDGHNVQVRVNWFQIEIFRSSIFLIISFRFSLEIILFQRRNDPAIRFVHCGNTLCYRINLSVSIYQHENVIQAHELILSVSACHRLFFHSKIEITCIYSEDTFEMLCKYTINESKLYLSFVEFRTTMLLLLRFRR